jgi:hypothetical protein
MDMLDLMILKTSEIPIFDFICENIYNLQKYHPLEILPSPPPTFPPEQERSNASEQSEKDPEWQSLGERKEKFTKEWAFNRQDLDEILNTLFPEKDQRLRISRRVYNHHPIDYFSRIVTEYVSNTDIQRDQTQLAAIRGFNTGDDKDKLSKLILNGSFREQWKNICNTKHELPIKEAIGYLVKQLKDANEDAIAKALTNWINFTFNNINLCEPKREYVSKILMDTILIDSVTAEASEEYVEENAYDEMMWADRTRINQFFSYYAIINLCFDDNGNLKKQGLFGNFFTKEEIRKIMENLSEYIPQIEMINANGEKVINQTTQEKFEKARMAATKWLEEHSVSSKEG